MQIPERRAALAAAGVTHRYGATTALDGVDLAVAPGECARRAFWRTVAARRDAALTVEAARIARERGWL